MSDSENLDYLEDRNVEKCNPGLAGEYLRNIVANSEPASHGRYEYIKNILSNGDPAPAGEYIKKKLSNGDPAPAGGYIKNILSNSVTRDIVYHG